MGPFFGVLTMAGSRLVFTSLALVIWLISRPGGWAVLVVLVLLALRVLPNASH
ncbi:hypothetical protein [Thioclava arctica]|uniref:hypothetical protein n=1 Tax=Thioclava arctica TaxID=3238301 RepID=UPI0034A388DD